LSHRAPRQGYDEPGFPSYTIRPFCPTSADGLQYEIARDGRLDIWRENARSLLALIIVLDQFPRNMFRSDARAFATDHLALALTKEGINKGFHREFSGAQLDFFCMPLMHSEVLDDHRLLADLGYADNSYAREHREAIERFGRYPTRNAALGRQNTPEETRFLGLAVTSD
jgi:uncharacterized protein (DUF924 family)